MYSFVRLRWGVCVRASDSLGGGLWAGDGEADWLGLSEDFGWE